MREAVVTCCTREERRLEGEAGGVEEASDLREREGEREGLVKEVEVTVGSKDEEREGGAMP